MKQWAQAALLLSILCIPCVVDAQAYPAKPVRVIIVFPPGGSNDVTARIVFARLPGVMGQQFLLENCGRAGVTRHPSIIRGQSWG